MDVLAAFGSLILTEGANAPVLVAAPSASSHTVQTLSTTLSPAERDAVDAVFTTEVTNKPALSPLMGVMVVAAGAAVLKGVVVDEMREEEDQPDSEEEKKRSKDP